MANTKYEFNQIRFYVRESITDCYVLIHVVEGDPMIGVQGWHKRSFPESMSCIDIMNSFGNGEDDAPIMWGQEAPPEK